MSKIPEEKFLDWNRRGLVPGPDETEEEYIKRAEYCLHLKSQLADEFGEEIPFTSLPPASGDFLEKPLQTTGSLFDIAPDWVPLFFSNYRLTPWHGGCTWIFQTSENSSMGAFLQLNKSFATSSKHLKIYNRDEFIAHELAHVGRMKFEEPKFEEFFAYRSSKSPFRKWFGPIIGSFWESIVFIILLLSSFLMDCAILFMEAHALLPFTIFGKIAAFGMLSLGLGRLWWRHRQFSKCLTNLKEILSNETTANAVIYRLTDQEIRTFSTRKPSEILRFARNHKDKSLRWEIISRVYFATKTASFLVKKS